MKEATTNEQPESRKRTERITNALCFIALIFLTCLCMLPIWWIFRSSLMSNAELFKWPPAFFPPRWLFSNYANTLEYFKFWTYLKNTMIIIVPSVIFGTITATMCGYAFARLRFRLRNFLFTLCVGSMLLPTMVTPYPAVHHVDEVLQHVQHVLAADPAVSLRRRRGSTSSSSASSSAPSRVSSTKLQRSTAQATSVSSSTSSFLPSNRR